MSTIATFIQSLKGLLPEGIADSGTITIWAVVLAALGTFVGWVVKALEDYVKEPIQWLFETVPRAIFVIAWVVFLVVAAGCQSWVMLGTGVILAPIIALARLRSGLPLWAVALTSVAAMAGAYWYHESQQLAERDAKRVYFILSFANGNLVASDALEIEESWRDCKRVLSDVFRRVTSVKIEINPASQDYKTYLWEELRNGRNFETLFLDRGRAPDVVLTTTISMYSSGNSRVFKSRPELASLKQRELVLTGAQWDYTGFFPIEDKPFVSLAIAAWVWRWVESQPKAQVTASDSTVVNKRILELYGEFLSDRLVPDTDLIAEVQKAPPANAEVARLLNRYHEKLMKKIESGPITARLNEKRDLSLNVSHLIK